MSGPTTRTARAAAVGAVVALIAMLSPVMTSAAQAAPADPETKVLAIVSPIAAPVCALTGSSTLLVPVVSGLVSPSWPSGVPTVGDLLLGSLGPVFVVCGTLPAAPGTRCQADDQIAAVVPAEISSTTGPPPPILGNAVDALNATLAALGLAPAAALEKALVCAVSTTPGITAAPPGPTGEPVVVPTTDEVPTITSVFAAPANPLGLPISPAPAATVVTAPPAAPQLVRMLDELVPSALRVLQLVVVGAIALLLVLGWTGTWRDGRRFRAGRQVP